MSVATAGGPVTPSRFSLRAHMRTIGHFLALVAVIFCFQLALPEASAQTEQASIAGTVTDASGGAVPDAKVTATNNATQVSAVARTNALGYYSLPYLPIGTYALTATKTGFRTGTVSNVILTVNFIATINIRLAVGTVRQAVTVTAAPAMIEAQQASLGEVVNKGLLLQLPNSGLDPYSLVKLAPGVLPNTGDNPIVQGGRAGTSEDLLDGADTSNSCCSRLAYTPPLMRFSNLNSSPATIRRNTASRAVARL